MSAPAVAPKVAGGMGGLDPLQMMSQVLLKEEVVK
jgi:hypothetical protein